MKRLMLWLSLLFAFSQAMGQQDDAWDSIDPNGQVIHYEVPPGGELYRACVCTMTRGMRTCECTKPAPTVAETLKLETELDIQREVGLSMQTAPFPVLRGAAIK